MTYVYACQNKSHPRVEVRHSMKEDPIIKCSVCHKPMHRVPQVFRLGFNAQEILIDWLDNNYRIMRAHPKDYRRWLVSPYRVKRPVSPIPNTLSDHRKAKPNANKSN
jgi:hypothetical protein